MNQQEAKEWVRLLPYKHLIEALAAGKTIQLNLTSSHWMTVDPDWSVRPDGYRVKPEPIAIKAYAVVHPHTGNVWSHYAKRAAAEDMIAKNATLREYVVAELNGVVNNA